MVSQLHPEIQEALKNAKFPREQIKQATDTSQNELITGDILNENAAGFPLQDLVNQLTIDETELYRKIRIEEFMDQNWENEETGPAVCQLVARYNKISNWVAHSILVLNDQKEQIKMFKKFVNLAQQLHEIQNYSTCTAILGGLSDASIVRLKRISTNLSEKIQTKLTKLKEIYSPINGYKLYRLLPQEPACIPALAVYLRDLTLTLDGNPVYMNEEKTTVNFERMRLVADRVLELYHIDTTLFATDLVGDSSLKRHLAQIDPPSSDDLYELSLQIEPLKSKKTLEEELIELEEKNTKLKEEIAIKKGEERQRLIAQQQVLEQIQKSNSKASTTVRALLELITESTSNPNEQIVLLKLQLQAALDLCIAMESQPAVVTKKK